MADYFATGRVVDAIIAILALEAIALWAWHRRTGRGIAPADFVCNLLAGLYLLLALRAALTGAGPAMIAFWLLLALVAHLADLWRRWRR